MAEPRASRKRAAPPRAPRLRPGARRHAAGDAPSGPGAEPAVVRFVPAHVDDWLAFFDGPAFADNARWSKCYCHYCFVEPDIDWSKLRRDDNRTAMIARIGVGEVDGFLARESDRVVGWLNVQPRHRLPHWFARMGIAPTSIDCAEHEAASVVCFVVDPSRRRRGVARALLRQALSSLDARGFKLVEAYPATGGESASDHHRGPLPLFLAEGFSIHRRDGAITVVRKSLGGG